MNPKPMPQCFLDNMGGKPYGRLNCAITHDETKVQEKTEDEKSDGEIAIAIEREVAFA